MFGRRRVGKTFLIRETLAGSFAFQHTGYANTGTKGQLFAFAASLKEHGLQDFDSPSNWLEAFELLKDLIRKSGSDRKVVFIDELSWMDSGRSDLMPALEGFWNGWASARKDIVLIVCESATSWMLSRVVHNKGGLYNRLTAQINLMPFTLAECAEYAASRGIVMNHHQLLECYMVMGGVPYYWSFLHKELSLSQNVDRIFFADDAPLKDEFRYLFRSLFKRPDAYVAIIEALGTRKAGMGRTELLKATGQTNSGGFTSKLEELEQCGFIRKYREYGKERKNAVYQLIDSFTLFHYKFLEKRPTDERYWSNQENTPARNAWCGIAFERVCLQHIGGMKKALGISGVITDVSSWCHVRTFGAVAVVTLPRTHIRVRGTAPPLPRRVFPTQSSESASLCMHRGPFSSRIHHIIGPLCPTGTFPRTALPDTARTRSFEHEQQDEQQHSPKREAPNPT